jgi:D-glycero-D-manno-heptose 1,7-bisphosphate phosphatase
VSSDRSPFTHRAVFLDRDGVINRIVFRDGLPASPRNLEEFAFNDGVREAVDELRKCGYRIIVVTNQPDLARKRISREMLDEMARRMEQEIAIDDLYVCPHDDEDGCPCRKPRPGMLLEAARKWDIGLSESFMIGDTWKDVEAGRAAGCKTVLLDAPYNQEVAPDLRVKSLSEAVERIKCFKSP